jgi:hypothetical protein
MPCTFARFVIHYKNGTTLIEDRNDPHCWDNASKDDISALGIKYDPFPVKTTNPDTGEEVRIADPYRNQPVRVVLNPHILKGSSKKRYGFFQMKEAELKIAPGAQPITKSLCVGMIIDKEGHCVVMRGLADGRVYTFYTTVHSLTLNLELFGIKLEECGIPIDTEKSEHSN